MRAPPKDVPAFKMFDQSTMFDYNDKTPGRPLALDKAAAERRWREGRDPGKAAKALVPKKKSAYMLFCDDKGSAHTGHTCS